MLPKGKRKKKKKKDERKHHWGNWRKSEKEGGVKAKKHTLSIYIMEF